MDCKKIFVGGPFNGTEEEKKIRTEKIAVYCVKLFNEGNSPISGLLMGLTFAQYGNLPTDTNTWIKFCENMLKGCDELHILKLEGWDKSSGVKMELEEARKLGIVIKFIEEF